MRTAFINQLLVEAEINEKIFLIVADLGFSVIEKFQEKFPNRFLNVGISEQNMAGIAAGLAKEGFQVFIYSIGNFPTLRCIEQIRYDVAYHGLSVTIVAVGAGYAYGSLGPSHHSTEDIGILRTIPDILICSPCDPIEAKALTILCTQLRGTKYLRLGKAGEKEIHKSKSLKELKLGRPLKIKQLDSELKSKRCVLGTGSILNKVLEDIKENTNFKDLHIYSFPFIQPIDKKSLYNIFKEYSEIYTIEEHQLNCGFGSAILEYLNDYCEEYSPEILPKIRRIGIKNTFISIAGTQDYLRKTAGLSLIK